MKMAKFRIRVESIDGTEELDERYLNGIECNGFGILADEDGEGHSVTAIHKLSTITLAAMMQASEPMRDAHRLMTRVNMVDALFGKIGKTEPYEKEEEVLKRVFESLDVE